MIDPLILEDVRAGMARAGIDALVLRPSPDFRYLRARPAEGAWPAAGERFETGMTVCLEPAIYLPDLFGARVADVVVGGEDGPALLGTGPRALHVLDRQTGRRSRKPPPGRTARVTPPSSHMGRTETKAPARVGK